MDAAEERQQALRLAKRAAEFHGGEHLTDAVGKGLAAVAHAVLATDLGKATAPQVWLDTWSPAGHPGTWVRSDHIVGVRVREVPGSADDKFLLEVFVPGLAEQQWLHVTKGSSEWFEVNAAERLLTLLEETARDENENLTSVFVTIHGEDKDKLLLDRNY